MTHVSLYRRYRPQTLAEVVGQDHVTRTLRNALSEDRIAHAYLFSGPRGTGKTSTARILAKGLNCETGPTPDPCNRCTACIEITEGSCLDVVEIDAASHGSVEDARDLREKVAYSPVLGRRKIYIIDECHMLSAAANNALLKVLEEPPDHVVFVFATTEPHKVLQTLLDRCQRYEFRSLDSEAIGEWVMRVCEHEGISIESDALGLIASRAAGSMRDALTLLDQVKAFAGEKVTLDDLTHLLGSVPEDLLFELIDLVSERDVGSTLAFTDRLIRSGRDPREFVRALVDHLRSLFLVLHAPAAQEILEVADEKLGRLRAQANRFDSSEVLRMLDLANEIQLALRQAIEGRLALEVGIARMTRPDLHATPASLLARIERLERLAGVPTDAREPAPEPPPAPEAKTRRRPSSVSAPRALGKPGRETESARSKTVEDRTAQEVPGEIDIEKITVAWDVILQKVRKRKISFSAVLIPARPVAWAGGELVLEFDARSSWHRDQAAGEANQAPLVEAFFDTFGVRPRIQCVRADSHRAAPDSAAAAGGDPAAPAGGDATMEEPDPRSTKDPVELVREGFGAEIVEES